MYVKINWGHDFYAACFVACHYFGNISKMLGDVIVLLSLCSSLPFSFIFSSVQSLSRVRLFATPWTAAPQASLSITNSWSLLKLMSVESVIPSNHLILYCPLLLLPSVFPSMKVFSNESALFHLSN